MEKFSIEALTYSQNSPTGTWLTPFTPNYGLDLPLKSHNRYPYLQQELPNRCPDIPLNHKTGALNYNMNFPTGATTCPLKSPTGALTYPMEVSTGTPTYP